MSREMGRDDLVISARSIFLNKGNRRKFSLFTLIIVSIIVLSLEYFKTGPINQFRSVAKDAVLKTSYIISLPFLSLKNAYYGASDLLKIHEENKKFIVTTVDEIILMIPTDGLIDIEAEKNRLSKELENITNEIEIIDKRLNNPSFLEKAPPNVIEDVKNKKTIFRFY